MEDDLPNGTEVVQSGISGLGGFFEALGGLALAGVAKKIDMELAEDAARSNPDNYYATTNPVYGPIQPPPNAQFQDVLTNLAPWQWAGLALAGGLTALLTYRSFA